MGEKGGAQAGQLLAGLQSAEALGGFDHRGSRPAQSHSGIAPSLHVATDPADGAVHVLDDVGAGQRAPQLGRQSQAGDGEDLVEPIEDAGRALRSLALESTGEIAEQLLGGAGVVQPPGLAKSLANRSVQGFRQALGDVAGLVDLTALDRCVSPEAVADRLRQGPASCR